MTIRANIEHSPPLAELPAAATSNIQRGLDTITESVHTAGRIMIKNFSDRDTGRLFAFEFVRRWDIGTRKSALRKLKWLDAAADVNDLRVPPGNRLEKLRGDRDGQYSIRVNDKWRICFEWRDGHAWNVEIVDYH